MSPQLGYRHQKVQRLRRLIRRRAVRESEGVFVIEGVKLVQEALSSGANVEALYSAPGFANACIDMAGATGLRVHELEPGVIERVGDTITPQPVLAVVMALDKPLSSLSDAHSLLVMVDVRDPGNAGTILRSAEASGVGGVVFCEGSVDVYNPKTVRASAGSLFHIPVAVGKGAGTVLEELNQAGFVTMGTTMAGGSPYDETDLTRRVALAFGNEANGLPGELDATLGELITIPIDGRSESLNVSMAASVLCFEAARQRRMSVSLGRGAIEASH